MEIAKLILNGVHFAHNKEKILYFAVDSMNNDRGLVSVQYKEAKELLVQIQSDRQKSILTDNLPNNQIHCLIYFEINNEFCPKTMAHAGNESADIVMRSDNSYWLLIDVIEKYVNKNNEGFMLCLASLQAQKPEGIL